MIQRRFSLKTLKDFGFGKQSLESAINTEIDELIEIFKTHQGDDYLLQNDFNIPIINILWKMIAGYRFTQREEHAEGLRAVKSVSDIFSTGIRTNLFPLALCKVFPNFTNYKKRVEIADLQMKFLKKEIEQHQNSFDACNPRDFIDVYLAEMHKDPKDEMSLDDLVCAVIDMFHAGTETSSTTLKWILLYLSLYPDVQQQCRDEVQSVLGDSGRCTMSHLQSLPYTMATITEIQRLAWVAPMSLIHKTSTPTKIGQFRFPAGSLFAANLSFISNDPSVIDNPSNFDPQRWIEDGKFVRNERLIPFGIGKRTCMGELLARNEIFLFTVNLVQKLRFSLPIKNPIPSTRNYTANLTRIPDHFHLRFESTSA